MLAPLEQQATLGNAVLRTAVDLGDVHTVTWDIPESRPYKGGEAKLSLLVRHGSGSACEIKGRSPLKLLVSATGTVESGQQYDRLVRNWYYTTNEPLDATAKLWESWGPEEVEYGLGGVALYPFEELRVSLEVRTPDSGLAACNPRLQLLPAVDYAIAEHLPFLRVVRDGVFALCVGVVLALAWYSSQDKRGDA